MDNLNDKNKATLKKESSSDSDPLALMKSLARKRNSAENASGSSNGGNNSDNSALVSLGNTSFGFNFDSEDGNSPPNSEQNDNSEDSDGNEKTTLFSKVPLVTSSSGSGSNNSASSTQPQHFQVLSRPGPKSSISSLTASSNTNSQLDYQSHQAAAANAVANLQSIANSYAKKYSDEEIKPSSRKRKTAGRSDTDSIGGYNTDDEGKEYGAKFSSRTSCGGGSSKQSVSSDDKGSGRKSKKKKLNDMKREERNAREKERSFRISKQINDLRNLLSNGGVVVPKGTKSSVLTEAANYIRMLQQHQYRSEIDRHQLVQQMQLIGSGAHGQQAAQAIRHVSAQNGVWSLGNFGGVPPKSAMTPFIQGSGEETPDPQASQDVLQQPAKIDATEYRFVFNSCGVGMAIASMGGAIIDCNQLFCQLCNYTKQELCSLTIFNLTARQDLQHAFDLISQMISPPMDGGQDPPKPIVLRGAMKDRNDLGLSIALVKGDDGIAKCFCVTMIKNPASPFDTSKPVPASFDSIMQPRASVETEKEASKPMEASPAFTSG